MASFREYSKRAILPFIGLAMAAYYVSVFLPLSKKAAEMDPPLKKSWQKLAETVGRTNAMSLDFRQITSQLLETRQALALLSAAEGKIVARLQPGPALREKMHSLFRLVDYQNELSQHEDYLMQQALLRKVQIAPGVIEGFPQHRMDITEPSLLWAALRAAEDTMDAAMACGATAVHYFDAPVTLTNSPSPDPPPDKWLECPVTIEFSISAAGAGRFLQSLALRPEELKPTGLPEFSPEKSVLFIDRLLIRRQTPEVTDEVRVWIKVVGFVMRE
jgi:hypothetical protein